MLAQGSAPPGNSGSRSRQVARKLGQPAPPRQHLCAFRVMDEASPNPPETRLSQVAKRQMSEGPQAASEERKARGARRPHLLVTRRDLGEAAALDTSAAAWGGGRERPAPDPTAPAPGKPGLLSAPCGAGFPTLAGGPAEVRPRLERAAGMTWVFGSLALTATPGFVRTSVPQEELPEPFEHLLQRIARRPKPQQFFGLMGKRDAGEMDSHSSLCLCGPPAQSARSLVLRAPRVSFAL